MQCVYKRLQQSNEWVATMTEHTKTDGLPGMDAPELPQVLERARPRNERMNAAKVECNACPVLCQISEGRAGACDRYANQAGVLVRLDPVVLLRKTLEAGEATLVPFVGLTEAAEGADAEAAPEPAWNGDLLLSEEVFVTGVGSSTTYPDYKPAPFIVGSKTDGVDMVTVVTEGIFSYCSFKVKIDTDRFLGSEQANVRCKGEVVGHVTTAEYGSQMLSLGGVHHLTGGTKKEGRITAEMMQALGNKQAVEFTIDGGSQLIIQAGRAPIVNGVAEQRIAEGGEAGRHEIEHVIDAPGNARCHLNQATHMRFGGNVAGHNGRSAAVCAYFLSYCFKHSGIACGEHQMRPGPCDCQGGCPPNAARCTDNYDHLRHTCAPLTKRKGCFPENDWHHSPKPQE
jgi:hypothetical protein